MAYKYNPRVSEREKRKITVWNGGIDDNGVIIYFKNLNYTNIDDLAKKLNLLSHSNGDIFIAKTSVVGKRNGFTNKKLYLQIPFDKENDFITFLENDELSQELVKIIKESGDFKQKQTRTLRNQKGETINQDVIVTLNSYDEDSLFDIPENLIQQYYNYTSDEEAESSHEKIGDTWSQILSNLDNKVLQRIFLSYETTDEHYFRFGTQLSKSNILEILSQKPDAVYVTSEMQWRKFNRLVKDDAEPIYYRCPRNVGVDKKTVDKAAADNGFVSGDMAAKLGSQINNATYYQAQKLKGGKRDYFNGKGYDLTDTYVIEGKEDLFVKEMGLSSNITAELNTAAQKFEDAYLNQNGIEKAPMELPEQSIQTLSSNLFNFCKSNDMMTLIDSDNTDVKQFGKALFNTVAGLITKYNPNIDEYDIQSHASSIVGSLASLLHLPNSIGTQYWRSNSDMNLSSKDAYSYYRLIQDLYSVLSKNYSINESKRIVNLLISNGFILENKHILKTTQNLLNEEFNNIYNRMMKLNK